MTDDMTTARISGLLAQASGRGACAGDVCEIRQLLEDRGPGAVLFHPDAPQWALWVAENLGDRAPDVEAVIGRNPTTSLDYARHVLRAPFEAGEDAISRDGWRSFLYAQDVLRTRFSDGEKAIATSARTSLAYAQFVGDRFEAGEAAIATDPWAATEYARHLQRCGIDMEWTKGSDHERQ
jgi:hypothetical protein